MAVAKKKMNELGVIIEGKDLVNFAFCPSYGKKLRSNTILERESEYLFAEDECLDEDSLIPPDCYETDPYEIEPDQHDIEVLNSIQQADFKDYSEKLSDVDSGSNFAFLKISDSNGNIRLVQKTTLCWFLEEQTRKMSNDRVLRVRQLTSFPESQRLVVRKVEERKTIRIGDWCIFRTVKDKRFLFLLGRVLQFQSLSNTNPYPIFEYTIERGKDSGEGTKASQKKRKAKDICRR